MGHFITVIVPVYNTEEYIRTCIDSILQQSYSNFEVLLIDDGSTDRSLEIIREYEHVDSRVKAYANCHVGLISTRKFGVEHATGDYICFVDSDDWIENNLLACAVRCIEENDVDVYAYNYNRVFGKDKLCATDTYIWGNGIYSKRDIENIYDKMIFDFERGKAGIFQSVCTKIIRKEILKQVLEQISPNITYGEDAAITFSIMFKINKISITDQAFYNYRLRKQSMCYSKDIDKFYEIAEFETYLKGILEKYDYSYNLQKQLKMYVLTLLNIALKNNFQVSISPKYLLNKELLSDYMKQIVLYGAGDVGQAYYKQLIKGKNYEIVAWLDKQIAGDTLLNTTVLHPSQINGLQFDAVIVAVKRRELAESIKKELIMLNVSEEKIVWIEPKQCWDELEVKI